MDYEALTNDKEFQASLVAAESLAEVVELLKTKGIEVTEEQLQAEMNVPEGELDENALDNVAGGSWISSLRSRIAAWRYKAGGGGFSRGGGGNGFSGGGVAGGR